MYKLMSAFLALIMICGSANAAYVELTLASDGNIDLPPAGFTATYSPTAPVSSIWFDGSISPQNPSSVGSSIASQFGGTLNLVGQNENFSSGSISLSSGFNVLAVHLGGMGGGNELLFFFSSAVTSFNVMTYSAGGSNNLSNFRAFNTAVVPVPAAIWLFASALLGFAGFRRR